MREFIGECAGEVKSGEVNGGDVAARVACYTEPRAVCGVNVP